MNSEGGGALRLRTGALLAGLCVVAGTLPHTRAVSLELGEVHVCMETINMDVDKRCEKSCTIYRVTTHCNMQGNLHCFFASAKPLNSARDIFLS